jgi:hypothetical protein
MTVSSLPLKWQVLGKLGQKAAQRLCLTIVPQQSENRINSGRGKPS